MNSGLGDAASFQQEYGLLFGRITTGCQSGSEGKDPCCVFSDLSLLTLSVFSVGVIVRLWLQFSSEGGERDCSSRGGGRRRLPGQQSGQYSSALSFHYMILITRIPTFNILNILRISIGLKCFYTIRAEEKDKGCCVCNSVI